MQIGSSCSAEVEDVQLHSWTWQNLTAKPWQTDNTVRQKVIRNTGKEKQSTNTRMRGKRIVES